MCWAAIALWLLPALKAHLGFSFFFSSRRRHTRCSRDWSSDVCSSDLAPAHRADPRRAGAVELMGYPPLDPTLTGDALERQLLATWKHERLFERTQEAMRYGPPFVFYEDRKSVV